MGILTDRDHTEDALTSLGWVGTLGAMAGVLMLILTLASLTLGRAFVENPDAVDFGLAGVIFVLAMVAGVVVAVMAVFGLTALLSFIWGRDDAGPIHRRNTTWAVGLIVTGILVLVVGSVLIAGSVTHVFQTQGTVDPTAEIQQPFAFLRLVLVLSPVAFFLYLKELAPRRCTALLHGFLLLGVLAVVLDVGGTLALAWTGSADLGTGLSAGSSVAGLAGSALLAAVAFPAREKWRRDKPPSRPTSRAPGFEEAPRIAVLTCPGCSRRVEVPRSEVRPGLTCPHCGFSH